MSDVAAELGIPMADILDHYHDKDAVADALFRGAWRAMLAEPPDGLADLPMLERLHLLLMRWFDALAPHRKAAGQMLADKLYPSHPHHWVPMVFNLSRTIHWLLDAAGDASKGREAPAHRDRHDRHLPGHPQGLDPRTTPKDRPGRGSS